MCVCDFVGQLLSLQDMVDVIADVYCGKVGVGVFWMSVLLRVFVCASACVLLRMFGV